MSDVLLANAWAQSKIIDELGGTRQASNVPGVIGQTEDSVDGVLQESVFDVWNEIPKLESPSGSIVVCDPDSYVRCGSSCNWTVPSGVTEARFQLWGPGGGTGGNCCCGGSPFGPTGAYLSIIKPVIAGEVYCATSGCAYCCFASQTTPGVCGSPSCLSGPGLSGVCVDSGISCGCYWNNDMGSWSTNNGQNQLPSNDGCAPQNCSGWSYCWDDAQDNVDIPFAYSSATGHGTVVGGSVDIINGMYPCVHIGNNNHSTIHITAPVYGFEDKMCEWATTQYTDGGCNKRACQGYLQYPGQGGFATFMCGGANGSTYTGDSGRMGMICIQYK